MYQFALFPVATPPASQSAITLSGQPGQSADQGKVEGNQGFAGILSSLQALADDAGIDKSSPDEWQLLLQQHSDQLGQLNAAALPLAPGLLEGQELSPQSMSLGQMLPPGASPEEMISALSENLALLESSGESIDLSQFGIDVSGLSPETGVSDEQVSGGAWMLSGMPQGKGAQGATETDSLFVGQNGFGIPLTQAATSSRASDMSPSASRPDNKAEGLNTQQQAWSLQSNGASLNGVPPGQSTDPGVQSQMSANAAAWNAGLAQRAQGENGRGALNTTATRPVDMQPGVNAQLQNAGVNPAVNTDANNNSMNVQMMAQMNATSEADAQFKTHFDALSVGDAAGDVADELIQPKQVDSAQSNRLAELQSRVSGAGLRQYATGVGVPVGDPEWANQMSQKIVWMTGRNIQSAEIQLNPRELGPVEVKIQVQNDQASITFNAQNASVRELLDANVHRLREMMDANGVELKDVDVGGGQQEQTFAEAFQQSGEGGTSSGGAGGSDAQGLDGSESEELVSETTGIGLVDYYA